MRKVLKTAWNEFIYGGHLHSIGVASLIYSASIVNGVRLDLPLFLIIYCGIHIAYLFNRYYEIETDGKTNPNRTAHIKTYEKAILRILGFYSLLLFSLLAAFSNLKTFIFALAIFVFGFLYTLLIKKYSKKVIGLKNVFIAVMFSSCLVLYSLYFSISWSNVLWFFFAFIFLRVYANTIFFDFKDIDDDSLQQIKTIPVVIGKRYSLYIIHAINIFCVLFLLLMTFYYSVLPLYALGLCVLSIYSYFYLRLALSSKKSQDFIACFYADGEYILWPFIILISMGLFK